MKLVHLFYLGIQPHPLLM